jgi:hypothetical protein
MKFNIIRNLQWWASYIEDDACFEPLWLVTTIDGYEALCFMDDFGSLVDYRY